VRWRRRVPTPLPQEPDCDQVAAVLQSYLDGELGAEDAEAVAGHLAHCDRCDIEATTVRRVITAIRSQRPDIEPDALERLAGFVDQLGDEGTPPDT